MAYDPAQDTIREKILKNIKTTLESIQGPPTYKHRVLKVERFMGNMMEFSSFPSVAIVPGVTTSDDARLGMIEHVLHVSLLLMVKSSSWKTETEKLIAECRVAMLSDWTRGGVALTTRGTGEDVMDSEPSSDLGGAKMDFEVHYRTRYHDPGTAT
jgi:hypothetical protein